jgi:hypothetical protein
VIPQGGSAKFRAGWEDNSFQNQWRLASNQPVNASMSSENGVLKLDVTGIVPVNAIVTAQRTEELGFNMSTYRYLKVSIMTSDIDVAARIVVWTDQDHLYTVLLKTYDDKSRHTEIIDLSYLGIGNSHLFMIELGWLQIREDFNDAVYYSELSFNSLEIALRVYNNLQK